MKKAIPIIVLLVIALAGAWYLSVRQDQQAIEQANVQSQPVEEQPLSPLPIQYPVEEIQVAPAPEPVEAEPEPVSLPSLEDSDEELIGEIAGLVGEQALEQYFIAEFVVSRMVSTIDSLTSARVAPLMLPVKPVGGKFLVLSAEDEAVISPQNAERYTAYADLAGSVDTQQAVALYVHYYPLFQEAYEAMGYPGRYFNDRLVEVIDHLLATPAPPGMISVARNEAVFEYENPDLEALSAGQKMLLRMGPENSQLVKEKLREVRAAVDGPDGPQAD